MKHTFHLTTRQIVFAALMIAATLVLEQLRIFHMPQGGSVTLGGMVPLILLAYLEGRSSARSAAASTASST